MSVRLEKMIRYLEKNKFNEKIITLFAEQEEKIACIHCGRFILCGKSVVVCDSQMCKFQQKE